MGEVIARNMLSWLELLINCYCCILLVVYIIIYLDVSGEDAASILKVEEGNFVGDKL